MQLGDLTEEIISDSVVITQRNPIIDFDFSSHFIDVDLHRVDDQLFRGLFHVCLDENTGFYRDQFLDFVAKKRTGKRNALSFRVVRGSFFASFC
jgi:hypothetical protein